MSQQGGATSLPAGTDFVMDVPFWDPHRLNTDRLLTAVAAIFLTAPSNGRIFVAKIVFCNTDTQARLVTLRWRQATAGAASGGGAAEDVTSDLLHLFSIAAGNTFEYKVKAFLEAGDKISAFADITNKVNMLIFGGRER